MKYKLQMLLCSRCQPEILNLQTHWQWPDDVYTSLRVLKSWWRVESFSQPWWSMSMESTSWWRTGFRQWKRERDRGTTQRPTSLCLFNVCGEKLWYHRCAIPNVACLCPWMELSRPKWMNEQDEVYRLHFSSTFSLLRMLMSFIVNICFEEHLNTAWNEGQNPCHTDWMKQSSGASIYFTYETYFYIYW